ncbi:MAG: GNAT family N-acetyltransferase [Vicinamibacterales bacterium]
MTLDKIGREDLEFLRQLRNAERRWFFDRAEVTPEAQVIWFERMRLDQSNHWYLVRVDQAPAGCFSIKEDGDAGAEVRSILLSPAFRGRGVMTTAITAAMDQLGHHLRYFAEIIPENNESIKLFTRLGFTTRAVLMECPAR